MRRHNGASASYKVPTFLLATPGRVCDAKIEEIGQWSFTIHVAGPHNVDQRVEIV